MCALHDRMGRRNGKRRATAGARARTNQKLPSFPTNSAVQTIRGDFHSVSPGIAVRYLHLVMIAYLLLTHLGFDEPDAKAAIAQRSELRLPSVPELQQHLRGLLWEEAFASLDRSRRYHPFVAKLRSIIMR